MAKRMLLNRVRSCESIPDRMPQPIKVVRPIGDIVKVSGEGSHMKNHYSAFNFDGNTYELGDTVLLTPDSQGRMVKPYVAMIKDIIETENKGIMLNAQWFYRPEDTILRNAKNMESTDARELFYSFHKDEVPAETVMHKCTIHFVIAQNHIPERKEYPGFVVQKVYDPNSKRLFKLTNNGFLHEMQEEIDLLVQKTMRHLRIQPNMNDKKHVVDHEDHLQTGTLK